MLQFKKFPDIPCSTREEARESRHIQRSLVSASWLESRDPFTRGRESIPGIPLASQEEAVSTAKARGTPGSCHNSQSPPDVSVHSRETCFPCTASTFKPRIDSHNGDTWVNPVGKPRGKASWESLVGKPRGKTSRESQRSLDPREGKRDTVATALEESARACPNWRGGLTPLGRLQK